MCSADQWFYYLPEFRVPVCRHCLYAVWPGEVTAHLKGQRHHLSALEAREVTEGLKSWPEMCKSPADLQLPIQLEQAMPGLPVYGDGLRCCLADGRCGYVSRRIKSLKKHWSVIHNWTAGGGRGGSGLQRSSEIAVRQASALKDVSCQRLFVTGLFSRYIKVPTTATDVAKLAEEEEEKGTSALSKLRRLREEQRQQSEIVTAASSAKEVSPWLQFTRWPLYLEGHRLSKVATLAALPRYDDEPILTVICDSLDRLVEEGYRSVSNDRINAFDQTRINSFLQRPRATDQPLFVNLQKSTYRVYKNIWKSLLSFVHRTAQPNPSTSLRHQFTSRQIVSIGKTSKAADDLLQQGASSNTHRPSGVAKHKTLIALDNSCLELCISLLDHELKGNLFESVVVGFFAISAIDTQKGTLKEACQYTSILSGFVKIAQMLILQSAVAATDRGDIEHPADMLDEMRERFMIQGTRSPFNWASRLRTYAKKVRDSTTSLGYIEWNDEGDCVSYRDIRNLQMSQLSDFVRKQIAKAQDQLEALLLLHPEETRQQLGIRFWMHRLVDSAVENRKGWNFLQHTDNQSGPLPNRGEWLFQRVLQNDWLRDEFDDGKGGNKMTWSRNAVREYKAKVEAFLERLLLLVHLTSGQPARGTEVLSLRHMNTFHGYHRSIFIENGMLSSVTSYHKGYSVTGSTKIIHRYLPKEVGELVIYYLWLILPFCQALELVALSNKAQPSPFIWAKGTGDEPWDSTRLSRVMKREFEAELGLSMTISAYRHLAIAISRRHLPCGGFKRDYGLENTKFD